MNRRELMLGGAAMAVATAGVAQALAAVVPERKVFEVDLEKFYSYHRLNLKAAVLKTTTLDGETTYYEKRIYDDSSEHDVKLMEEWLNRHCDWLYPGEDGSPPKYQTVSFSFHDVSGEELVARPSFTIERGRHD